MLYITVARCAAKRTCDCLGVSHCTESAPNDQRISALFCILVWLLSAISCTGHYAHLLSEKLKGPASTSGSRVSHDLFTAAHGVYRPGAARCSQRVAVSLCPDNLCYLFPYVVRSAFDNAHKVIWNRAPVE